MKTPIRTVLTAGVLCVAAVGAWAITPQPTPGNVFRAGDVAVVEGNARPPVHWRVLDVNGATLASGEAPDGYPVHISHPALGGRLGAFMLSAVSGEGGSETNETRFAFIPADDIKPCKWVGTGFHYGRDTWGGGDERLLDLAALAGIGIVRDEPGWAKCEPVPGQYGTSAILEALVDGLAKRGMAFCCLLSYDNPGAYPEDPLDADAFARWTIWMSDHLKGRCDTFEIWNEPHNFRFWLRYGPLEGCTDRRDPRWMRHFTDFSRTVDDALAGRGLRVGVGAEDWPELLHTMLEQGIARPHNLVTLHPYDHTQPRPERAKWFRDGFADLRRRIAAAGAEGAGIAITEVGWTTFDPTRNPTHDFVGFYPPVTFQDQARYLVRMYLMARQVGAEFVCQYDFKDDGLRANHTEDNFGLLDYWGHPKPSYAAIAAMTRLVGDAEPEGLVEGIDPAVARIYRFRREDGATIYAAWSVEGETDVPANILGGPGSVTAAVDATDATERVPPEFAALDLYGNPIALPKKDGKLHLTEQPVYFIESGKGLP